MNQLTAALAVLCLLLGISFWGYSNKQRADKAESRAEAAEAQVRNHQQSLAVLDEHLKKAEQERRQWEEIATELEEREGAKNQISPYLRGVLERMR